MPFPDALPPEIWSHIASAAAAQQEGASGLIPWLQVAPRTSAKWMHDAAFAQVFRDLDFSIRSDDECLEATLLLSRYAREEQLREAVRSVVCHWDSEFLLDDDETPYEQTEFEKRERTLKMIKELICEVLQQLPVVRELSWSNSKRIWALPLSRKIYNHLAQHFHSLTILSLSECEFDGPLDLSSANSLSTLYLTHVRLLSTSSTPSIVLNAKIHSLILDDIQSRDESHPRYYDDVSDIPPEPPNPSFSSIIASLDLSQLSFLEIKHEVLLAPSDLEHVFPAILTPRSVGGRLHTLRLLEARDDTINALFQCQAFPSLRECYIDLEPYHVLSPLNADRAISRVSSFIGKQKTLENLGVSLADMYTLDPDDFEEENTLAYERAIAKSYLRDACAGLKQLRRLSLGTFAFGPLFPLLDEQFVPALSELKFLVFECVTNIALSNDVLDNISRAINRYPNLTSFGYIIRGAAPDDDYEAELEENAKLAAAFSTALIKHAPRIEFFFIHNKLYKLTERMQEMPRSDPESLERYKELCPAPR